MDEVCYACSPNRGQQSMVLKDTRVQLDYRLAAPHLPDLFTPSRMEK